MKIEQSSVSLTGQYSSFRQNTVQESLRAWVGNQRPDFEAQAGPGLALPQSAQVAISEAARQAAQGAVDSDSISEIDQAIQDIESDQQMQVLISLVETLTGRKIRLLDAGSLTHAAIPASGKPETTQAQRAEQTEQAHGWGVEYDRRETVHESELTHFEAQGVIRTADGKAIEFSVSLEMKREFFSETTLSLRAGDGVRKDPLVINFDGTAAQLTGQKFAFDIDADGKPENISFVGANSGFLALDKNANGKIDDGSELFGTSSGNGFADLAAYDDDHNGWIDENDAVYAKLLIWTRDAAGNDILNTLAERNIGALYLGSTSTPFDLNDSNNMQHGQVRSTGVFLYENGRAGTMQQVDLIV